MKVYFRRKVLKSLIVAMVLLATSVAVYAAVIGVNRYRSNPGDSFAVSDASGGGCQVVSNSAASGKSYFIPTKTTAEWNAFKNAVPQLSGVSLSGAVDIYTSIYKDALPSPKGSSQVDTCDGDGWNMYTCPSLSTAACTDVYTAFQLAPSSICDIAIPLIRIDNIQCKLKCDLQSEPPRIVTWDTTTDYYGFGSSYNPNWGGRAFEPSAGDNYGYGYGDFFLSPYDFDHYYDGC